MEDSDIDEDLELALALSMQRSPSSAPTNNAVVDLTSDNDVEDEDEDLKQAIAQSMQHNVQLLDTPPPKTSRKLSKSRAEVSEVELTKQAIKSTINSAQEPSASILLVMDRRAMEAERLARLAERKRKRSPSLDQPSKQKSQGVESSLTKACTNAHSESDQVLQYPRGAIKRTFAVRFPRTDDITIDEVLQASTLKIAVISSFQWDADWLGRKLSHAHVKQYWVMNARERETQARWRQDLADCGIPNLRIHFPPMNTVVGNAHSKYMLLVSEKKLRLVVSTANMEPEYWGEVKNNWQPGVLENSAFLIDLPRRADGLVGDVGELTPFGKELVHFLEAQQLEANVVQGVLKFDFAGTGHLAFVHSIGAPSNVESHPTGLPGLAKAVQDLELNSVKSIELDYAASSLGAVDETLLQRIYAAAQGVPYNVTRKTARLEEKFRIYYPTEDTIKSSIGGTACAGIVSLKKAYHGSATFPLECLRDYVSTRKGMISHNKLLFARGRKMDGTPFAWVYVGSANMSESAWGAQKVLKSGKLGKLTMRNWECGVVVAVPSDRLERLQLEQGEVPPMSVFEGTIEVPFQYPGEAYNGRRPWVQDF